MRKKNSAKATLSNMTQPTNTHSKNQKAKAAVILNLQKHEMESQSLDVNRQLGNSQRHGSGKTCALMNSPTSSMRDLELPKDPVVARRQQATAVAKVQ